MEKKYSVFILVILLLALFGVGLYFSDFFKVLFGISGNVVRVVG